MLLCVLLLVSFRRFWRSAASGANGANRKLTLITGQAKEKQRKSKGVGTLNFSEIEMDARNNSEMEMLCLGVLAVVDRSGRRCPGRGGLSTLYA